MKKISAEEHYERKDISEWLILMIFNFIDVRIAVKYRVQLRKV